MAREKSKRGFAKLEEWERKEIARLGGLAAQAKGTAHKWNSETSKKAIKTREDKRNAALAKTPGSPE